MQSACEEQIIFHKRQKPMTKSRDKELTIKITESNSRNTHFSNTVKSGSFIETKRPQTATSKV